MNTLKAFMPLIPIIVLIIHLSNGECPESRLIAPCVCNETTKSILCQNIADNFDFKLYFTNISKNIKAKDFYRFTLENSVITKLMARLFSDLHFKRFEFINCTKLTWVSQEAFGYQTPFIEELVFEWSPVINSPVTDLNIFDAINRLPSIKLLDLSGTQLIALPDEAFVPILDWLDFQLRELLFCKPTQMCRSIKSVGKKAFYYLNEIQRIDLSGHLISFIDDNAFSLHNITNKGHIFEILLNDNHLNGDSFTENSFIFIGRPTHLILNDNKNLTVLKQQVFEPFLQDNIHNQLNITGCPIDWNSSQMNWFKDLSDQFKRRIHF